MAPAPFDPRTLPYWQQDLAGTDWAYGHYFKYLYHFSDLLRLAPRQIQEQVWDKMRQVMGA